MSTHTKRSRQLLDLLRAANAYTLPVDAFCRTLGVSRATFYRLVSELREAFGVDIRTDGDVRILDVGVFNAAKVFELSPRSRADYTHVDEFGINPVGQKVGKLVVIARAGRELVGTRKAVIYRCRCDCGNELDLPAHRLRSGNPAAQMRSCYDCRYTRQCLTCGKAFMSVVPSNSCSDECRIARRQTLEKARYQQR